MLHIVPKDIVDKFTLLKIFQKKFNRDDLKINKINASIVVDRTLKSNHMDINKKINESIVSKKIPTIKEMITEIL